MANELNLPTAAEVNAEIARLQAEVKRLRRIAKAIGGEDDAPDAGSPGEQAGEGFAPIAEAK